MNFDDITSTVHNAWKFCWPPAFACFFSLIIFRYIYPVSFERAINRMVNKLQDSSISSAKIKEILEPFSLTAAVPFISIIIIITILYFVNRVVNETGNIMPPYISYQLDKLWISMAGDKEIVLLLRRYSSESINSAIYLALQDDKIFPNDSANKMTDSASFYYINISLIKWSIIVVLFTIFFAIKNHEVSMALLGRSFFVISLCALTWSICLVLLLYFTEQDYANKGRRITSFLLNESTKPIAEISSDEIKTIQNIRANNNGRWWNIYFYEGYKFYWFKKTFIPVEIIKKPKKKSTYLD